MLVIPPVSDRGMTRPRVEASAMYPNASKKTWFAVYTAASSRKVCPGSVGSQANPILPACLHRHTTVEERGSTGGPASRSFRVIFSSASMPTSGFRWFRPQASSISWVTAHHRYPSMIRRSMPSASVPNVHHSIRIPFRTRRRHGLHQARSVPGSTGTCTARSGQFDICSHHSANPEIVCYRRASLRPRIGRLAAEVSSGRLNKV